VKKGMLATVAVAATAVVAAGCGGGSSSTTTSTAGAQGATLSKSQFLAKGNAICKKGNQAIQKAAAQQFPRNGPKPSASQIQDFAAKTVIPNIQEQVTAIKALPAPTGDEAQVTAITDAAQSALDKAKQDPASITGNGPGPFAHTNELARAYGLTVCAGGGG
jgi:hypothetical protein